MVNALANDGIVMPPRCTIPATRLAKPAGASGGPKKPSPRGPWHPAQFWAKMPPPVPGANVVDGSGSGVGAGVNGAPAGEACGAGEACTRRADGLREDRGDDERDDAEGCRLPQA